MSDVGTSSYYTTNFTLRINKNIFSKINNLRLRKVFESRHEKLFQRFFNEYFFDDKFGAQLWKKNADETEFWKVYYEGSEYEGTYYVSTEKVINALHFIRDRYKEATLNFDDLIWEFEAEVFYETNEKQKLTNEEWVENMRLNVTKMNSLLGVNLVDSVLSPEISEIYRLQTSTFNPESQWKIQGIEILRIELFQIEKNLMKFGFHGKQHLQRIVESYIAKCDKSNDQNRFCNFISFVTTVADNVQELIRKGKVLDLSFIASKDDRFDLLLPQPPEDYESLLPASSKPPKEIGKVEKGFENLRDFHWNVKCINDWVNNDKFCPDVLRECVKSKDPSEQLRKLNALGKKIFFQNSKKMIDSEHNPTLQIVDFDAGLVAVYKRTDKAGEKIQYFLQMISKIVNPEKVKTDSLKVLFDPDELVEDFVKREKAYEELIEEEKNSSSKYYIHRKDEHKNGSCNSGCWCSKNSFSENDIRASVLRYLADSPRMKNASAGAAHSIKHYKENAEEGQDWIDRLEMLRGVNLKYHIKQYLSAAKKLVEKLEGETEEEWLERLRSKFTYSFGNSGVISVNFGIWSGRNDGIFVHLSITKDKEMFIKTLFTGKPASKSQEKCFGLGKVWNREEKKKSKKPIEVDIKKGSGYIESDRRLK